MRGYNSEPSMKDLLQRPFWLIFGPLYMRFTTAPFLAHFLDLDPSIYVVALYQIVGGGDLPQSRELSPRFARQQQ